MLCVLLHPLQVLLVAFETPGIVFDLWHHVALLQAQVENIWLLLHLISVVTAKVTTRQSVTALVDEASHRLQEGQADV